MPAKAQPPALPPVPPPTHIQTAGKQEDFREAALALAAALGWDGPAHYVTNEIAVGDARGFIAKTLHEHFIAGATGAPQPSYLAACQHLAVDNEEEQDAIDAAMNDAYEAGKGSETTTHPVVTANLGEANLHLNLSDAVDAAAKVR